MGAIGELAIAGSSVAESSCSSSKPISRSPGVVDHAAGGQEEEGALRRSCRPRASSARTESVLSSVPHRALMRVVLPTPEEPMRQAVIPGRSRGPGPARDRAQDVHVHTAGSTLPSASWRASAVIRTEVGLAAAAQPGRRHHSTRRQARSSRAGLRSWSRLVTTKTKSRLLASTCRATDVRREARAVRAAADARCGVRPAQDDRRAAGRRPREHPVAGHRQVGCSSTSCSSLPQTPGKSPCSLASA